MSAKSFWWITACLVCVAGAALAAVAAVMSVQVRKAEVRNTPSFLGDVVANKDYGDKVSIVQEKGAWLQVAGPDGQPVGWMHNSALTKKNIVMNAGEGTQTAASSGEMALAGKGFNSDVEAQFKASHREIDFSPVDRMEKVKIAPARMRTFVKEGGLVAGQGGAQ